MRTSTILLTLSALVFSSTAAHVHQHIHRRCAPSSSASGAAPTPAPAPTTLSTSFVLVSSSTLAASGSASASASPPAASPPSPSSSPGASTGKQVTINPGDTLEKIAAANGVGICDIVKANNIKDPNLILAGEMLSIPVLTGEKDDESCLP